jgi:hypothetical protein
VVRVEGRSAEVPKLRKKPPFLLLRSFISTGNRENGEGNQTLSFPKFCCLIKDMQSENKQKNKILEI